MQISRLEKNIIRAQKRIEEIATPLRVKIHAVSLDEDFVTGRVVAIAEHVLRLSPYIVFNTHFGGIWSYPRADEAVDPVSVNREYKLVLCDEQHLTRSYKSHVRHIQSLFDGLGHTLPLRARMRRYNYPVYLRFAEQL